MATATRSHTVVNRGRRRTKNKARRRLTAKQIKFFGTAQQKAALKRSRRAKRAANATRRASAKRNTAHRKRTAPKARRAARRTAKRAAHRRRSTNPSEILSLVLPNTGRRGSMAAKKNRKHHKHHNRAVARRHNRGTRHNDPGRRRRYARRHNPGMNVVQLLTDSVFVIGGAVGSKILTQAVLQSKNTGIMGYFGNAVSTAVIAWAAHAAAPHKPHLRDSLILGGVVQIVLRGIADYAPVSLAAYARQFGVGDYQATGFAIPQRAVDALNRAEVEVPPGWGPGPVVAAVPGGVSGDIYGSLT